MIGKLRMLPKIDSLGRVKQSQSGGADGHSCALTHQFIRPRGLVTLQNDAEID
jgi:hypothetical protein